MANLQNQCAERNLARKTGVPLSKGTLQTFKALYGTRNDYVTEFAQNIQAITETRPDDFVKDDLVYKRTEGNYIGISYDMEQGTIAILHEQDVVHDDRFKNLKRLNFSEVRKVFGNITKCETNILGIKEVGKDVFYVKFMDDEERDFVFVKMS